MPPGPMSVISPCAKALYGFTAMKAMMTAEHRYFITLLSGHDVINVASNYSPLHVAHQTLEIRERKFQKVADVVQTISAMKMDGIETQSVLWRSPDPLLTAAAARGEI